MRQLFAAAAVVALALVTTDCGGASGGTGATGASTDAGGGPADAGPAADGGSSIDAGGGATDAGGGSSADAGSDGGTSTVSECDGLMPDPGAQPITITTPSFACGTEATSDYSGNIALGADSSRHKGVEWVTYDAQGNQLGSFGSFAGIVSRDRGFQTLDVSDVTETPSWRMVARAPNGTVNSAYTVGSDACLPSIHPVPTGGSIVLSVCGSRTGSTRVLRFDDGAGLIYSQTVNAFSAQDPVAQGDASGAVLVVSRGDGVAGFPSTDMVGRWLNPDGSFLTDWIVLASDDSSPMTLRALIGGSIAVKQSQHWRMVVSPGQGPSELPGWLSSRATMDVHVVRGNKAYAFASNGAGQEVEVVTPNGVSCGKFDARGSHVQIGGDGTVVGVNGGCKRTVWPGLLGVK